MSSTQLNWKGEGSGGRLRKKIKLNTSGCCFLCLSDSVAGNQETNTGNSGGAQLVSLSVLRQYLQINLSKEFTSNVDQSLATLTQALKSMKKSDFVVEVCGRCQKVVAKTSELVQMFEILGMEVSYGLKNIRDCIAEGDGSPQKVGEYQRRMKSDICTFMFLESTENLRRTFANECSKHVANALPKVKLSRITPMGASERQPKIFENKNILDKPKKNLLQSLDTGESENSNNSLGAQLVEPIYEIEDDFVEELFSTVATNTADGPVQGTESHLSSKSKETEIATEQGNSAAGKANAYDPTKIRKVCNLCQKVFGSQTALREHCIAVHGKSKSYICSPCNKTFCDKRNLEKHYKTTAHHRKTIRNKTDPRHVRLLKACKMCQKRFGSESGLREHIKYVHKRRKEYICSPCNKVFYSKSTLTRHYTRITHFETAGSKTAAVNSQKKLENERREISRHCNSNHGKSKKYICSQCNKVFHLESSLTNHYKSKFHLETIRLMTADDGGPDKLEILVEHAHIPGEPENSIGDLTSHPHSAQPLESVREDISAAKEECTMPNGEFFQGSSKGTEERHDHTEQLDCSVTLGKTEYSPLSPADDSNPISEPNVHPAEMKDGPPAEEESIMLNEEFSEEQVELGQTLPIYIKRQDISETNAEVDATSPISTVIQEEEAKEREAELVEKEKELKEKYKRGSTLQCRECLKKFKTLGERGYHYRTQHTTFYQKCEAQDCFYYYNTVCDIDKYKRHRNASGRARRCPMGKDGKLVADTTCYKCKKTFYYPSRLKLHVPKCTMGSELLLFPPKSSHNALPPELTNVVVTGADEESDMLTEELSNRQVELESTETISSLQKRAQEKHEMKDKKETENERKSSAKNSKKCMFCPKVFVSEKVLKMHCILAHKKDLQKY